MNVILLLAAAAAALVLWPKSNAAKNPSPFEMPPGERARPTYQASLSALATVRLRLLQTESLDEKAKAAIDSLTLGLVAGSDKE
jgi:hypothetical protein